MHFIFDRDGTIIKDMHYLSNPNDVELLPKAKTTLHKLKDLGYDLHIHTNQSGVQRGYFTEKDIGSCMQKMFELFRVSKNFLPQFVFQQILTYQTRRHIENHQLSLPKKYIVPSILKDEIIYIGDRLVDLETAINFLDVRVFGVNTGIGRIYTT